MSKRKQRQESGLTPMTGMTLKASADSIYGDGLGGNNSAIKQQDDGSYIFGSFVLTPVGFDMPDGVTPEEYWNLGELIFRMEGSIQWLIGDYAFNAKEDTPFGEAYRDLMERFNRSYSTISKYKHTVERIPFFRRRKKLEWSKHTEIAQAELTDKQRWALLEECESNGWSVKNLREEIAIVQGKTPALPPTPLEKQRQSSLKTLESTLEKAMKSDDRAGWVEYAEEMAERWRELAKSLESE